MEAPNWLISWLKQAWLPWRESGGAGEPPRVLIFTNSPTFVEEARRTLKQRGCHVDYVAGYADVSVHFGQGSSKPNLVLVDAGPQMQSAPPIDFIRGARACGYRGMIVGRSPVREVLGRMIEAGANKACVPHLWAQIAFPCLKLAA